ncbi:MAG: IclR family transcriptional regulator [Azospirillaceae bacterium]
MGKGDSVVEERVKGDSLMVGSVEKAFRILEVFTQSNMSLSLTELSALTGMNKSAVQRFAHSLERMGYLVKDPATKRYRLSVRVLELSAAFVTSNDLISRVTPYLLHVSKETDETVSLSMLYDKDIIFLSRFMNRNMLHTDVVNGTRMPAYCTAPGVAMLAALPRQRAVAILNGSDLRRYTAHTTCDVSALIGKLDETKERGFATAISEYFLGDISIAAALLDASGEPVGAISVGVPDARYSPEAAMAKFAPIVMTAARNASLK